MADQQPEQLSLFPTRDSLEEVIAEASANLPITEHNELVALIQQAANTTLKIMEHRL